MTRAWLDSPGLSLLRETFPGLPSQTLAHVRWESADDWRAYVRGEVGSFTTRDAAKRACERERGTVDNETEGRT